MFSKIAIVSALAAASVSGQVTNSSQLNPTTYAPGLVGAFAALNLTTLISVATANALTFLPILIGTGDTRIVFAPTNAAFAAAKGNLSDPAYVTSLVNYHLLSTNMNYTAGNTTHQIVKTSMTSPLQVNLPKGGPQVVVLSAASNASVTVVQALGNVVSIASAVYLNLQIYVVDTVLSIPQTLSATAVAAGLTSLVGALTTYAPGVVPVLDAYPGITVFAPNNAAFTAAMAAVGTLNNTQISNVLLNHVVEGSVVYSSGISNGATLTTASGQILSFIANATGAYVVSGPIVAKIILADVLIKNGVVHVIDGILANPDFNATAAAAAAPPASNTTTPAAGNTTATTNGTATSAAATAAKTGSAAHLVAGSFAGLVGIVAAFAL